MFELVSRFFPIQHKSKGPTLGLNQITAAANGLKTNFYGDIWLRRRKGGGRVGAVTVDE